jgi:nucleoside-diphosphate-sugar epimerase
MLKILVTGVNGFVGKHLARELKSRGYEVMGLGHEASAHPDVMKAVDKYEVMQLLILPAWLMPVHLLTPRNFTKK